MEKRNSQLENMDSQWSKQEAYFACATQVWLAVNHNTSMGVQWLSGRVLDLRQRGRQFELHRRHCVVVLEQDTFILA